MITLAGVELPGDLEWLDEYDWSPVTQQIEPATDGALHIEESALLAGRPITLGPSGNSNIWISRATADALRALLIVPRGQEDAMALVLEDEREFNVLFRHGDKGMEARPVMYMAPSAPDDRYTLTLRLMAV